MRYTSSKLFARKSSVTLATFALQDGHVLLLKPISDAKCVNVRFQPLFCAATVVSSFGEGEAPAEYVATEMEGYGIVVEIGADV